MDSPTFILLLSLLLVNVMVYYIFRVLIFRKENAGMKFLILNISKDVLWLIVSLSLIVKTKENMLVLMSGFLAFSFVIYFLVIRLMNKS